MNSIKFCDLPLIGVKTSIGWSIPCPTHRIVTFMACWPIPFGRVSYSDIQYLKEEDTTAEDHSKSQLTWFVMTEHVREVSLL